MLLFVIDNARICAKFMDSELVKGCNMKKIILLASVLAMVVSGAKADYRTIRTNNCHPVSMHSVLDNDVRKHHAVITEVVCDTFIAEPEPIYVAAVEPVYYIPAPMEYIPIVDCVPYPTTCEYCAGRR